LVTRAKQALFLKTKNIGDSIILTASIAALPSIYQYIDVVCLPESEVVFRLNKRVRHIFTIPRDKQGIKKIVAYIDIYRKILKNRYDLLAHFSSDWRGAILARLLNPELCVSRRTSRRNDFWHRSFKFLVPSLDQLRPMVEQDVDLLRVTHLYKNKIAPAYDLNISATQKNKIKRWLFKRNINLKRKLIVIHASARWKFKEIPVATWAKIIDELKSKNMDVVISGTHRDLDNNFKIVDQCGLLKPFLTHNFSLVDTAALFALADLVVTIDSMSTHLASAVKTPVVSIFGPTNEKNWGPWGGKYKVIGLSSKDDEMFACRPCGQDGCDGSKVSQCLVQIDPKMVLREALKLL